MSVDIRQSRETRFSPGPRKGAVEYRAEAIARSRAFHISAIDPPAFVSAGYEQIRFACQRVCGNSRAEPKIPASKRVASKVAAL